MAKKIDRSSVIRLFENNGFDHVQLENGMNTFRYNADGVGLEFVAPWIINDMTTMYDLAAVRDKMNVMLTNAKNTIATKSKMADPKFCQRIFDAMVKFGMQKSDDEKSVFYNENGKTIFYFSGAEKDSGAHECIEAIIERMNQNPKLTATDVLNQFKNEAMQG